MRASVLRARRSAGEHVVGRVVERLRARWRRSSLRGSLLFLLPVPLWAAALASLLLGDYPRLGAQAAALALLTGGALFARRGIRAEERWRRRRVVRAPAPWKTIAAVLVAAGAALLAGGAIGHPWPVALGFAAAGFAGVALTYGLDPRHAKTSPVEADGYSTEEIEAEIDRAERGIARLEAARERLGSGALADRLGRIAGLARDLVGIVEAEPRHLRRTRRFLRVYLDGAQQVCEGLPRTQGRRPPELEERCARVLGTIEDVFADQRRRLLDGDVEDLDVQIEVLAHQLRREQIS
jgi:hypothetical protein